MNPQVSPTQHRPAPAGARGCERQGPPLLMGATGFQAGETIA